MAGFASDVLSRRVPWRQPTRGVVITMMMIPAAVVLVLLLKATEEFEMFFLVTLSGLLIGGPANMMSSSVAADLAFDPSLSGNTEALATVTGIIDGTGAMTAAIGVMLLPVLHTFGGWSAVFVMLVGGLFGANLLISKIVVKDVVDLCRSQERNEDEKK